MVAQVDGSLRSGIELISLLAAGCGLVTHYRSRMDTSFKQIYNVDALRFIAGTGGAIRTSLSARG